MLDSVNGATAKRARVACFIDGFNLYHAIDALHQPELKWIDLSGLMRCFISPDRQELSAVNYFSAYAEWLPGACARHKEFVSANQHLGVAPVLGMFKTRTATCKSCGNSWAGHEEKQTDVNIAIAMVREAYKDSYDEAFLVTCDSDLAPALELVREVAPTKRIKMICPPGRRHSKELCSHATNMASIKPIHLQRNLMPERIIDATGAVVAVRPAKYAPRRP